MTPPAHREPVHQQRSQIDTAPETQLEGFARVAAMIVSILLALWYVLEWVNFTFVELATVAGGLTALWLPIGGLVSLFTRDQFDDWLSRFTFSSIASYGLTTTIYFGCAVLNLWLPSFDRVFYVLQIAAILACAVIAWRRGGLRLVPLSRIPAWFGRIDWILVMLLAASSVVTARYKNIFELDPSRKIYLLTSHTDQAFYTSMAYECLRNTPMLQTPYRAGLATRAYHMFPHLTTALVGRYTLQPDLIRAHLVYEYTFLETFTLLAVFCISRRLAGSRGAGYVAVALMFLAAIPFDPLVKNEYTHNFFYFCLWPQASSAVEPLLMTSPQMYSGNLVTYGILLAMAVVSNRVVHGAPAGRLMLVASALAGIMIRFRIQTFLPLLPGMLLLAVYYYRRTHKRTYLVAGGLALALAVMLILEMRLSIYMPNTSSLKIGNNRLGYDVDFINSWPGAKSLAMFLGPYFSPGSEMFLWVWQIISLTLFDLLNVVGIPLFIAAMVYLLSRRSWSEFGGLMFLIAWLVITSIAGAACLSASYDNWSVGGQMLLHTNWYLFALLSPGLWRMGGWIPAGAVWKSSTRQGIAFSLLALAFVWQCLRPPSLLERELRQMNQTFHVDEFDSFRYIRSHLPINAVIVSNQSYFLPSAFVSGFGGRRAYAEYTPSQERFVEKGTDTEESRNQRVVDLWNSTTEDEFCKRLPEIVTHVVEIRTSRFAVPSCHCLKKIWTSSNGRVRIWEVIR